MTVIRDDLVTRLLDHCSLMCETGQEGPIADAVETRYRALGHPVARMGNSLVVGRPTGDRPLVLLVGHLDVVAPTEEDREPRVEQRDGRELVVGRGSSDMKSGNVVAMRVFEDHARRPDRGVDLALVLYAAEEGPDENNELTTVLEATPWLAGAGLAVVLEPTDGQLQLGCLGGLHATLSVHGRQAHSARPWHGDNALVRAARLITAIGAVEPTTVEIDGVGYRDVWSLTQVDAPNGRNVIPGIVHLNLNFRFSPSRDVRAAEAELRAFVAQKAREADVDDPPVDIEVTDRARPAPPRADAPLVAAFRATVGAEVTGKQAWTDVARLDEHGIPALNFGPGRTDQAHQRGEFCSVDALEAAHTAVDRFVRTSGPGGD